MSASTCPYLISKQSLAAPLTASPLFGQCPKFCILFCWGPESQFSVELAQYCQLEFRHVKSREPGDLVPGHFWSKIRDIFSESKASKKYLEIVWWFCEKQVPNLSKYIVRTFLNPNPGSRTKIIFLHVCWNWAWQISGHFNILECPSILKGWILKGCDIEGLHTEKGPL